MKIWRKKRGVLLTDERGFTLPELLTTIAILGILLAIAMAMWNSVIEARRVDAAANQLASDLRLANTRATNQLTDWRVVLTPDSRDYQLVKLKDPYPSNPSPVVEKTIQRSLPEGTKLLETSNPPDPNNAGTISPSVAESTKTIEFSSDGSARALGGASGTITVSSEDEQPKRKMTFVLTTSRIKLD